ncbi:hypothetical protein GX50_03767 [[Emmonsia] crescens]|uniref:C2H2-type domain-containing protein n=1 Tax=[Emmonsia] crescens TaxID=73230 RepID=A0A2B7ZJ88_9EURO|nr:hypothetical protein GX50_03767 [Emmonsia crescens]
MQQCSLCNRSFKSEESLEQHAWDSLAHALSYDCILLRELQPEDEQHIRDFWAHAHLNTPLDRFFQSFSRFLTTETYLPPNHNARLQRFAASDAGTQTAEVWSRYQDARREEVKLWFGSEDSLILSIPFAVLSRLNPFL